MSPEQILYNIVTSSDIVDEEVNGIPRADTDEYAAERLIKEKGADVLTVMKLILNFEEDGYDSLRDWSDELKVHWIHWLVKRAEKVEYGKLCPMKIDRLQKIVEKRDEMNKEHVLDHKLPADVTKKIMSMTKDKKGGKTLKNHSVVAAKFRKKTGVKKSRKLKTKKSGVSLPKAR